MRNVGENQAFSSVKALEALKALVGGGGGSGRKAMNERRLSVTVHCVVELIIWSAEKRINQNTFRAAVIAAIVPVDRAVLLRSVRESGPQVNHKPLGAA